MKKALRFNKSAQPGSGGGSAKLQTCVGPGLVAENLGRAGYAQRLRLL